MPVGSIDRPAPGDTLPRSLVRVRGSALCEGGPPEQLELLVEGATATVVGRGLPSPRIAWKHSGVQGADEARWEAVVDLRGTRMASVSMTLLTRMAGRGWGELAHASYGLEPEGPRAGTRSRAAFTIVQNEPVFLPLWLAHYRRYFDPDDIYVLDHDSTDGSTSGLTGTCNVLPVHRSASFDHDWLRSTAEQFQSFLLASYETVLYAEADEFIVAEPTRHSGLDSYIEELRGPAACCTGYEVVHYPSEQPLRLDSPILGQRQYWHSSARYTTGRRWSLRWSLGVERSQCRARWPSNPARPAERRAPRRPRRARAAGSAPPRPRGRVRVRPRPRRRRRAARAA